VLFPKRGSLLSTTLRRLVFVKQNMHLIPHDSLVETEMSEYNEGTDSWVQIIVEATEQHDLENELQSVARHAKEDDVAGVNQDVVTWMKSRLVKTRSRETKRTMWDALLEFERHLLFSMASVALSIGLIQHHLRFPIYQVKCILELIK
jgi:hypothetical protein